VAETRFESPLFSIVRRVKPVHYPVLVAAHRGDSQNAPENTLASFRRAVDDGADLVELDVQVSADGDPIVIHDEKIDRTTEGKGEVRKLRTQAIQELDAGSWFSSDWRGEKVPTLDETLDLLRGRAVPMIEVKVKTKKAPDLGRRIVALLERHGMLDKAIVIARERARADEVRAASPATPIAFLTYTKMQARGAARVPGVAGLDIYWKSISVRLLEALRGERSIFFTPWTVNRRADMERLLLLGCESLITDCPTALRDLIDDFEFERTREFLEKLRAGGADYDLEEVAPAGEKPDEIARAMGTDSEVNLESVD
jgi:glycerophosphoryl diester phosphodiesterase